MARCGPLFIALILEYITLSVAIQNPVPIFVSEIDTFLDTENYQRKESSVFDCVKRCVAKDDCKSINYKKQGDGKNCFLNKKNRREAGEAAIKTDENFVHYDLGYHIQRSEKAEFGTAHINMPTVPPVVPGPCYSNPCENGGTCIKINSNNSYQCQCAENFKGKRCKLTAFCDNSPCKNGGTCVEVPSENTYKCNCTDTFTGKDCGEVVPITKGNGEPSSDNDYDFELVFRRTLQTNYLIRTFNEKYISHFTVCAWIYTPGIEENQTMTVISILTKWHGRKKVLTVQIDGQGGFIFSFGADRSNHPNLFSTSSPKDSMVFVCVRVQSVSPYMDVIINANFSSKVSSDSVMYKNVKWTQVIIGQDQNTDGTVNSDHPFEGRISGLNIWQGVFSRENTKNWYNKGIKYSQPDIIKWPQLGVSANRVGDVYFVQVTSASRNWRNVMDADVVIEATSDVAYTKTYENGVVIEVERNGSPVSCSDMASPPVDGILISVSGSWKRISYKQTFLETQKCFAIFGSVPSWYSGLFKPRVSDFDLNLDELWKEEFLGPNVNQFNGVNTLCGDGHFWMVNRPNGNTPVAGVSLRRMKNSGGSSAGISTFGKCGAFKFNITDIRVLE